MKRTLILFGTLLTLLSSNSSIQAAQVETPAAVKAKPESPIDPRSACLLKSDAIPKIIARIRDDKPEDFSLDSSLYGPIYFGTDCLNKSATIAIIPQLAILLTDPNSDIRMNAITAFDKLTLEDKLVLRSPNPVILEGAVKSIVPLLQNQNRDIRNTAASALGSMEMEDLAKEMIPELIIQLKNVNPKIRLGAAEVLINMRASGRSAIPQLISMLKDPVLSVRNSVISALVTIGASSLDTIDQIDEIIKNDPDPDVRKAVSEALDYFYYVDHERIRGL